MDSPPPRLNPNGALRRTPRTRHAAPKPSEEERTRHERARGFARVAIGAGVGDDVGTLTNTGGKTRFILSGQALYLVCIMLVAMALVVVLGIFSQRSTEAIAIQRSNEVSESGDVSTVDGLGGEHGEASETTSVGNEPVPPSDTQSGAASQLHQSEAEPRSLIVHVSGAVESEGLVEVPSNARVNDVIVAAGGLSAEADTSLINLAATVADAQHIHVPAVGEDPLPPSAHSGSGDGSSASQPSNSGSESESAPMININTADRVGLEAIPGVGPVTAGAIIAWREDNGAFTSVDQLIEVSGIGPKTLEALRPYVTV